MLQHVLHAFETATGPLSLDELSRELGIERGALEGMIAFWVRKGRLQDSASPGCGGSCGSCGAASGNCTFKLAAPRTITLLEQGFSGKVAAPPDQADDRG